MIVDKGLIKEAKRKLGDKAAFIIAAELELKEFDDKNLKAICKWHEEDTPSLIWNPKEDSYKCFGCGKVYGIIDHYMAHDKLTFLGAAQKLFQKVDIKHAFGNIGIKQREYKYPRYLEDNNRILAEKYLATRGISPETLDYFDVKQYKGNVVFNFYDTNDVLTTVKLRPSRKLQKGEHPKMWFLPNYDNKPILYGMNKIDPTKPLLVTEGECLTGSAEVLTPDGWIRLDEYDGEQVMQVDENMSGGFVTPLAYIKKEYSGDIYISKTDRKSYYSEMTPSHNFVYYNYRNTLTRQHASSLPNRIGNGKIPTAITHNGGGIPLTNEEIALFIAVSADGSIKYRKNYDLYHCRFTVARDDKYLRMKYLLDELGIEYTDNPDIGKKTKDGKTSFKYLGFLLPKWMRGKEFPMEWVQQATLEQKLFILQELLLWDGNKVKGRRYTEYWSISENNADFIQAIAATSGIMATKRMKYPTRGNHSALWGVKIIYGKEHVSIQRNFFEKEHYDGMVYCVTVPTGMFLMRQNNKISVIGNCDALSAYEAGYSNVVSIPSGTENKKWIDECWDWLEQFDKIILAYDNDDAGIKARKDVASRLGIWRTQYIIIEDKFVQEDGETPCKDLNEVLINYGKDAVMSLIESAQDIPVEGVNNLSTVGVFDIEKAEGLYTSLKPLDDIVYKFLMGSVVVFTGKRSSGKSSFINQTFANGGLNQGYDIFYYSGELDPRVLKSWLDVNLAGEEHIRSEQGGFVRIIDKTALQEINKWYNGRVWVYDNHSHKATDIINTAQATTRRYGTKIWIIDNLMMLDLESDGDMSSVLQKQKEFISNLVRLAQLYNVLVVLAIHPRKGMAGQNELTADDVSGSGDLTNMSQYVISAHRYTDREKEGEMNNRGEYKKGKEPIEHDVCIEVLKNRFTGKNGKADLYFNYADYRFYSNEDELYRRYKWNKSTEPVKKKKRENEASAFFIE